VFVCMLTLLRTILSAARGVLWKPERNSMKFFREILRRVL
jgi:hypothetical protein